MTPADGDVRRFGDAPETELTAVNESAAVVARLLADIIEDLETLEDDRRVSLRLEVAEPDTVPINTDEPPYDDPAEGSESDGFQRGV